MASRLDQGDDALCDELARLGSELRAAAALDPALEGPAQALDGCWNALSDVARDIGRYAERAEADPGRLADVEDRLFRLEGLLRQHGPTLDDVLAARERIAAELAALASVESRRRRAGGRAQRAPRRRRRPRPQALAEAPQGRREAGRHHLRRARRAGHGRRARGRRRGASLRRRPRRRAGRSTAPGSATTASIAWSSSSPPTRASTPARSARSPPAASSPAPSWPSSAPSPSAAPPASTSSTRSTPASAAPSPTASAAPSPTSPATTRSSASPTWPPSPPSPTLTSSSPRATRARLAKSDVTRLGQKERVAEVARMLAGAKVTGAAMKAATELIRAAHERA